MRQLNRGIVAIWAFGSAVCLTANIACTPDRYADQADRAAYATISSAQDISLGGDASAQRAFDVTYKPTIATSASQPTTSAAAGEGLGSIRIGDRTIQLEPPAADSSAEAAPEQLSPAECLEIAIRNSRSFQTRKESLYASALAVANARRSWNGTLLDGVLTGDASRTRPNRGEATNSAAAQVGPTWSRRLIDGGVITLASTLSIASDLLGTRGTTVGTLLEANITQPLLRGAWRGFAYETQYRLERDFIFSVFEYERFTQTFAVGILQSYYSVLQQRDQLANEQANIDRLGQTVALTDVLVDGGQVSPIQLDQAEQNLLDAQVRMESLQQSYRNSLDEFKITIGLPIRANVAPSYPSALQAIRAAGPRPIPFDESQAIAVAFTTRPDVLTQRASVRDAGRDVEIAADGFNPQLDLTLGISTPSRAPRAFEKMNLARHTRSASVTFNYELDQTDNRDAYRNTIIAYERAKRDYDEFADNVRLEVRRSYRRLIESRRSYELRLRSVTTALRRRKLAALQQKEGLASARDVLEAEEALRDAQNGLTGALVSYTTTRFSFMANLGMLWVDERGQLHERAEPFRFHRIEQRYGEVTGR